MGAENGADIRICYEDHDSGQPVVLIHGYRSTRTPGASGTRPAGSRGAADLNTLLEHPDLTAVVVDGFTIGTGEVTRRLVRYGSGRVAKASMVEDRYASFEDFLDNFYNTTSSPTSGSAIGPASLVHRRLRRLAVRDLCLRGHLADLLPRPPIQIDVPTLVVHGTEDRILPYQATAAVFQRQHGITRAYLARFQH